MLYRQLQKTIAVLLLISIVVSCTTTDPTLDPTEQELAFQLLEGSWTLDNGGAILLDQQDVSAQYNGFALSFTDGSYTTVNAGELFPASDTWAWVGESSSEIELGDGRGVMLINVSLTELVFSFRHEVGGVANGLAGNYSITLTK